LTGYLGLAVVVLVAAVLFVPRLPRPGRVAQQAGTAPAPPARSSHAGGAGVPVVQATFIERKPYDHDCFAVEISDEEMIT